MAAKSELKEQKTPEPKVSKEEMLGYHKGSLSVLTKEREELLRMVSIVEQLMQMHSKALGEMGVDTPKADTPAPLKKVPIEHLL